MQAGKLAHFYNAVTSSAAAEYIRSLMFHWYGNYTLQLIINAAGQLRSAALSEQVSPPADVHLLVVSFQSTSH